MYERILVPTDGSDPSAAAVDHALELARVHGAEIHVVYVVDTTLPVSSPSYGNVDWTKHLDTLRDHGRDVVDAVAETARELGMQVRTHVAEGARVHERIVELAGEHDVDLVVMGTHGHGGVKRFLLGSVAERVLRQSPVPVLAVPMVEGVG